MSDSSDIRLWGLVAAAGAGRRMGSEIPKQYLQLGGVPVIVRSINALAALPQIQGIVAGVSVDDERFAAVAAQAKFGARFIGSYIGGASRADTVRHGLRTLQAHASDDDWVLVHDAARPFVTLQDLEKLVQALGETDSDGAVLGWPLADSLASASDGRVERSVSRAGLWRTATPQAFRLGQLASALDQSAADDAQITDELSAMTTAGFSATMVACSRQNFKITTPEDLAEAEMVIEAHSSSRNRIGKGFDVHAFAEDRRLVLGGVEIPHDRGLAGHSDADVALHALCDALLGAAGLGDIGRHFPDTDSAYEGVDSRELLRSVVSKLRSNGWAASNVDITIIAQAPKIAPHVRAMTRNIADDLGVSVEQVNVKATTTEGLGFTGRREGIAAEAIAMIGRSPGTPG